MPMSKQYTYLRTILDETINLESYFNTIFKKLSYKLFQFSKIRKYLPIFRYYKQAVLSLVEYVCYLMYLNRKHNINKLQKLQKHYTYVSTLLIL